MKFEEFTKDENEQLNFLDGCEISEEWKEQEKEFIRHLQDNIESFENLNESTMSDLMQECKSVAIDSLMGPFGITGMILKDKVGGNVTTQHNAEKGIFAKESEGYNREDYEKTFKNRVRNEVVNERKVNGVSIDEYSGKETSNPSVDHGVSAKEYHRRGGWMQSKEQRDSFGSDKNNLFVTDASTNSSMQDKDVKNWEKKQSTNGDLTNKEKYDIDDRRLNPRMQKAEETAQSHLPSTMDRVKYQGTALLKQCAMTGVTVGARQALGLLLKDFIDESYEIVRLSIKEYKENDESVGEFIKKLFYRFVDLKEVLMEDCKDAWDKFVTGAQSGALSDVLTFIINNFITTAKNIVTIIREGTTSVINAIKVLTDNEKGYTKSEKISAATNIIITGVTTCCGIALLEAVADALKTGPFAPFADDIANVLVGLITGLLGVLVIYLIKKIQENLNGKQKAFLAVESSNIMVQMSILETMELQEKSEKIHKMVMQQTVEATKEMTIQNQKVLEEQSSMKRISIQEKRAELQRRLQDARNN